MVRSARTTFPNKLTFPNEYTYDEPISPSTRVTLHKYNQVGREGDRGIMIAGTVVGKIRIRVGACTKGILY